MREDVVLVGDMNINLLKHTLHSDIETYLDTLLENSFLPLITLPTRIGHNSATILDYIPASASLIFSHIHCPKT